MKHTITLGKGTILAKNADFLQQQKKKKKNDDILKSKWWGVGSKRCNLWNYLCKYLRTKFHVSSIILMSFR